jgi:glycosyltransferase involved in cell wall biosynthesis
VVDASCGIKIPAARPRDVIARAAAALAALAASPERRDERSRSCLRRSALYSWERKAGLMNDVYAAACTAWPERKSRHGEA